MKTILALTTAALFAGSAVAQDGSSPLDSSTGSRHMFEFNTDSVLNGVFKFQKSKTRGSKSDNDTALDLDLGYAYSLPSMPRIQVGGRLNYLKATDDAGDREDWGFMAGVIYNHSADLMNSVYASLYAGLNWNRTYGTDAGNDDDEVLSSVLAVGKRFGMKAWGIDHLVYTPEIALTSQNSTTGSSFEYNQDVQLRFLQFAVFF